MNKKVSLFIVSLTQSVDRRRAIIENLRDETSFEPVIVDAIFGADLPWAARAIMADDDVWADRAGEIGCFLSHLKTWERLALSTDEYSLVIEDDIIPVGMGRFLEMKPPEDADLIFVNRHMSLYPDDTTIELTPVAVPIMRILPHFMTEGALSRRNVGTYAYAIRPEGARKLVSQVRKDGLFGNVDWRLLRYAVSSEDIRTNFAGTELDAVVHRHHNPARAPAWNVLKAYGVDRPLAAPANFPSTIR